MANVKESAGRRVVVFGSVAANADRPPASRAVERAVRARRVLEWRRRIPGDAREPRPPAGPARGVS
jgi:hypothetical protein